MKRAVGLLVAAMVLVTGCAYVSREALPEQVYTAPAMQSMGMEKFTHREETRYGFRLVFIPVSVPDPVGMVREMVVANQAAGVTNLDVEFSEFNVFLFQIPKMTVRADLVRKTAPTARP